MRGLVAVLVALWGCTAAAQTCKPRASVLAVLTGEQYQESMRWRGLHKNRSFVFELWEGPEGNWSLLRSHPNGTACIMAYGDMAVTMEPEPLGEDG